MLQLQAMTLCALLCLGCSSEHRPIPTHRDSTLSDGEQLCTQVCNRAALAFCSLPLEPDCVERCKLARTIYPDCTVSFDNYLFCARVAKPECGADGSPTLRPPSSCREGYLTCSSGKTPAIDASIDDYTGVP